MSQVQAPARCSEDETRDRLGSEHTMCSGGVMGEGRGQQGGVLSRWGAPPIFFLPTSHQVTPGKALGPCDPIWTSLHACPVEGSKISLL